MTNLYSCDRCGYTTNLRSNFKKHLERKTLCKPIKQTISIEKIKEKYGFSLIFPKIKKPHKFFKCEFCHKQFAFRQGKSKHQKDRCKEKIEYENNNYWKKMFEKEKKEKEIILKDNFNKQKIIDNLIKQIENNSV